MIHRRRPLTRFHDVGTALSLPRDTHSFSFDDTDLNRDGIADLVLSTHGRVELFLNHRPGLESTFVARGGDIHGCAAGDANRDGWADVYCTRGTANGSIARSNSLWIRQPGGSYVDQAADFGVTDPFGRGRRAVFFDFDHRRGIDLFVGNENPRLDDNSSRNRVFTNTGGTGFTAEATGMRANVGALCAQAFDQNRDGWQDLLVCGGVGPATIGDVPHDNRLHLFRNLSRPGGTRRRLVDVAPRLGIDLENVQSARLAYLNVDRHPDLLVVTHRSFTIWPGLPHGRFGLAVHREQIQGGQWVTAADVDGRFGLDALVVTGCNSTRSTNFEDRLFLDTGPGWRWQQALLPRSVRGCGDTAQAMDLDGDGTNDLLVGNGQWSAYGPIQVLTSGRYWG